MDTFHFELTSPEKLLFSGEVEQVDVPGSEGDFGVLAGHAPFVALLRPGILTINAGGRKERIVVYGGFAEVGPDGALTILADTAHAVGDLDRDAFAAHIGALEAEAEKMDAGSLFDKAITRIDNFKQVREHINSTAMH